MMNLKNCFKANKKYINYIGGYYIDEENMCSKTENCAYYENNIWECRNSYFLDLDNNYINDENWIYSKISYCVECRDKYYFNRRNNTCVKVESYF